MSASSILSSPVLVVLLVIALQLLVHTYMASTQHGELCSRLHQIEEKLAALLEGSRDTRYSGRYSQPIHRMRSLFAAEYFASTRHRHVPINIAFRESVIAAFGPP